MGREDEPLKGFSWRGGIERNTMGILMWSKPFLATLPSTGEEVRSQQKGAELVSFLDCPGQQKGAELVSFLDCPGQQKGAELATFPGQKLNVVTVPILIVLLTFELL